MNRPLFFLNLLLALVLGFAIGAGIGWINGQKERPAAAVVRAGPVVK